MQQILGNKNHFVEQAIKQHEWWEMSKLRIIRPSSKENSRMDELTGWVTHVTYNWQLHLYSTDGLNWTSF